MIDLSNLPAGLPQWLVISLVILGAVLTASEKAKNLPGIVGSLARFFSRQTERKLESERNVTRQIRELVDEQVQMRLAPWKDQVNVLTDQLSETRREHAASQASFRAELAEQRGRVQLLSDEIDLRDDYITEVTSWARRVIVWAADKGLELPNPPWSTFYEWRKQRKSE